MKLKLPKLSKSAWIATVIIAILAVSIAATAYYYYVIPHPARLRILYTHSDQMISDVANNFTDWYKKEYGRPIEVTLTLVDPQSAYETVTNPHRKPEAEIWWGGPLSLFEKASNNLLPYNSTRKKEINKTVPSCPLMDPNQTHTRWYAASLYALGVMYNEHVLNALNLSKPQTWADLLKEEYEEKIAMTNATRSEFTQPFIMLVIQSQNWTQGWEYLVKLAAFVRDFDNTEVNSVSKVVSGYLPLAIVPDFYAYEKMAIPILDIGFTYLDVTVLQPDPIAIIKRGDYQKEAKAFVDYVLTQQAQSVVGKYRLPVRRDATVVPPRIKPFDDFPYILNYNQTFEEIGKEIVKDYYQAWISERHEQIKTAFEEIREANRTMGTNPDAIDYYSLAWQNFTYAGHYMNRTEIDTIYNKTNGWTVNTETYTDEWWPGNSTNAYSNAIENAALSKQAVGPNLPLVAYYPYEVSGHNPSKNYTQFLADLDLIKDLGFKGIKMHDVWNYWNANILVKAADDLKARGLKFICQLYYYESSEFPENTTRTDEFIAFVSDVASKLQSKSNLLWYALHYPWNWTERETYVNKVNTTKYREELQRIIDAIKANDSVHPIYMVSESIEYYGGTPPYNLTGIAGFGYQPYSHLVDDIQKEEAILENYRYFKKKGLKVYIDEWGVQTSSFEYGKATNETSKAEMITEFVNYTQNWKIVWCYFGLYDLLNVDWGIANSDNSLKLGGEAMKEALKTDV